MSFMELQVRESDWAIFETNDGGETVVEADHCFDVEDAIRDYGCSDPESFRIERGYCGRFSAPGYMDRTDWVGPYTTRKAVLEEMEDGYCDCYKDYQCPIHDALEEIQHAKQTKKV